MFLFFWCFSCLRWSPGACYVRQNHITHPETLLWTQCWVCWSCKLWNRLTLHQNLFLRSTISVDATDSMTKSYLCKDFFKLYYYLLLCFIYFYILIILFGCFNLIYLLYYFCHFNPFGTFYFSLIRPPSLTWGPQFENPWPSYYYSLLFIKQ